MLLSLITSNQTKFVGNMKSYIYIDILRGPFHGSDHASRTDFFMTNSAT